jgi:hypothetical protein
MSPSGILQRCLCQPTALFSRWFGPKGNEHQTAGIAVGEGGSGAYGMMNDGGGGGGGGRRPEAAVVGLGLWSWRFVGRV